MEVLIYQVKWEIMDSNTYLIIDKNRAVVIDPADHGQIDKILQKHAVRDLTVLLTHEHFDHIIGLTELRRKYSTDVYAGKVCSEHIQNARHNLSSYANVIPFFQDSIQLRKAHIAEFSCGPADHVFDREMRFDWMNHMFYLKATPGHSAGSICILMDEKYLFTGDSLLADYDVITRFPGGSRKQYEEYTESFFMSLSEDIWVCPGHGRMESLGKILKSGGCISIAGRGKTEGD